MKKSKIKYIFELVFIFILPLVLLLPSISINNDFVYDDNGNFQTSKNELSFVSPLNYVKDNQYINYLDFNQLVDITDSYESDIVINDDNTLSLIKDNTGNTEMYVRLSNTFSLVSNHKYFFYVVPNIFIGEDSGLQVYIASALNNYPYLNVNLGNYRFLVINNTENSYIGLQIPQNSNFDFTFKVLLIDLTQMFGVGYEPSTIDELEIYINLVEPLYYTLSSNFVYYSDNIVSSNHYINYTILGKIKLLFTDYLDFNDSPILDLFMSYTFLWLMMFISWHLFYLTIDFLLHFWKKEDD